MTTKSRIRQLHDAGVSVWLDDLSRPLLQDGTLARLVTEHAVSGVTSNPAIFAAALRAGDRYDPQLDRLLAAGTTDPRALFFALALQDVGDAARLLRPTYDRSGGRDGFVSFECTPDVAHDTPATVEQARWARGRVAEPNLMIKVPATDAGIAAIEELTAEGVSVNVTLLFGASRYEQAARAYLRGLERRVQRGEPIDGLRSVASFFVSRIDARVDELAEQPGTRSAAIAAAQLAFVRARELFSGPAWRALEARGAHPQRPLWASTAPKTERLADVAYVEALALPGTIVTVPAATLAAFADHGRPRPATVDEAGARRTLAALAVGGIDPESVAGHLEVAGLRSFAAAYDDIVERLEEHVRRPAAAGERR
jgi:transaldolase